MLLSTAMRQSGTRGPTSLPHWPLPYLQNPHPISVSASQGVHGFGHFLNPTRLNLTFDLL